jgi:arylsulfatase B
LSNFKMPQRLLLPLLVARAAAAAAGGDAAAAPPPPKLIMTIVVDDLGSADLGFTGSGIATPELDGLAAGGVVLTSFYVQPICTPSRAALLTGRLPLALGLQGKQTVQQGCAWGLDVAEQTFPQALQAGGWATHMVGKMHLGADLWARTPTYRGFDSFFGYLYGAEDYYTHKLAAGFDLRNDVGRRCGPGCSQAVAGAYNGTYSTPLFGSRVEALVADAGARAGPTFIHFAPQAVHAPNEAPAAAVAPYLPVFGPNNTVRAVHAGALATLDAAVGGVLRAVAAAGLANDTLILVLTDNGGPLGPTGDGTMASNYPRRGGKHSLYEGGVNGVAFAWGPRWLPAGATWPGLAHIVDVGPTLLEAAGVPPLPPLPGRPVHGASFWGALRAGAPSGRQDVVANIDYTAQGAGPQAALVTADGWKLILGAPADDTCDYWTDRVGKRDTNVSAVAAAAAARGVAPGAEGAPAAAVASVALVGASPFWPLGNMTPTLYNLTADPRETTDVAAAHPGVVAELVARLAAWGASAVAVVENATADPRANPALFANDSWTPWLGVGDGGGGGGAGSGPR